MRTIFKMKQIIVCFLVFGFSFSQKSARTFVSFSFNQNVLKINTSDGTYKMLSYGDDCVETNFIPTGEKESAVSHAVVAKPSLKSTKAVDQNGTISWQIGQLQIKIQKSPFKIEYCRNGELLLAEKAGYYKKASSEVLQFALHSDEKLMGGGARALGMNRRGNRLALYNRAHYGYETKAEQMNFCLPIVLSSKRYLVHFDNPTTGYLDLDSQKNNTLEYECLNGRKTYQIITGDSWERILKTYTALTGRQPLPPKWAFGQFSSRFGYHSQDEVNSTLEKFESDSIPVDAIVLDLFWFGKTIKGTMGNLEWDKDQFPKPEEMIQRWKKKGVQTVLITEPFILNNSLKWNEAVQKQVLALDTLGKPAQWEFYFGTTGLVDVFSNKGKTWFWEQYQRLINQGVEGIWGDLGEPEVFPSWAKTAQGTADEVHNIYGHEWAKLLFEGYQKKYPSKRPFILMRAGYSGSQRYGMIPWSGDVNRSWGGLQSQVEIALQMGLQGIGYMHSDLGGFAGDYFDNELYMRWVQYGVFQPIFRPHAQEEVASEVARKDIATKSKIKEAVLLRYRLLPYNYSLAFDNQQTGQPMMRPLFYDDPSNMALYDEKETYYWGPSFLIKPITLPGIKQTTIAFPKTANWFDFYTHTFYAAGSTATIDVSETSIPTFVRGGSFVPMRPKNNLNTSYNPEILELHYYFDPECAMSNYVYYDDDGQTPQAVDKGIFEKIKCESTVSEGHLKLSLQKEIGAHFKPAIKEVHVLIHAIKPSRLWVNGQEEVRKNFGEPLEIRLPLATGKANIQVQF